MEDAGSREMSMRELIDLADIIVASGRLNTGVLGGEPLLHPQFPEMVSYLLARGIQVRVFTNGLGRDELMDEIEGIRPRSRFKFVVNVNFPEIESERNRERQERFINRFAPICDLGLNVFRADLDPLFLADLARRTGVRNRRIRVGLAQPIVGEANQFLGLDYYRQVAANVVRLAEAVFDLGMVVSLDCGFPLCSFTDEQLGRLRRVRADTKFVCTTATDLAPGRQAWSCFPLAKHNRITIDRSVSLKELEGRFLGMLEGYRQRFSRGVFAECAECAYLRHRVCDGGCLAHVIPGNGSSVAV
jgi:hypothetical protein